MTHCPSTVQAVERSASAAAVGRRLHAEVSWCIPWPKNGSVPARTAKRDLRSAGMERNPCNHSKHVDRICERAVTNHETCERNTTPAEPRIGTAESARRVATRQRRDASEDGD